MIVYPTSESKTDRSSPPWASIVLTVVWIVSYGLIGLPLDRNYEKELANRSEALYQQLDQSLKEGTLSSSYHIQINEDLTILADQNFSNVFPPEVIAAYGRYHTVPRPLEKLQNKPVPTRFLLALVAHQGWLLILGAACIMALGFLFEHIYDRQVLLSLWLISSATFLIGYPHIGSPFSPSIIFAWSYILMIVLFTMALSAPRSVITFTCRGWLGRAFSFRFPLPSLAFPLVFTAAFAGITHSFTSYQPDFSAASLLLPPAIALVLTLFLLLVPSRDQQVDRSPDTQFNRMLAQAESHFEQQQPEPAFTIIQSLLDDHEQLEMVQVRRLADLAWKHHDSELTEKAFRILLRRVLDEKEPQGLISIAEEMVFRDVTLPGSILARAVEFSIRGGHMPSLRKLLDDFRLHQDISADRKREIHRRLFEKLRAQKNPDRAFIFEIKEWLVEHDPENSLRQEVENYLIQSTDSALSHNYSRTTNVRTFVTVDLLAIGANAVRLSPKGSHQQEVPWTAVLGLFGCNIGEGIGLRGSILIRFQGKIFSCDFDRHNILVRSGEDEILPFEKVWDLLQSNLPDSVPTVPISEFPRLEFLSEFQMAVQSFSMEHL